MKQPTAAPAVVPGKGPALTPEIRAKIAERNKILAWLGKAKERETELRRELVSFFVSAPKEGTNAVAGEGYEVKVGHKVSRKLDAASLDAVMTQFPAEHPARVVGNLIQFKPALVLDFYRTLSAEDRKIFDQALTITDDGLPELEIVIREETPTLANILAESIGEAKAANPTPAATPAVAPAAATSPSALPLAFVGANGTPKPPPLKPAPPAKKSAVGSSTKRPAKPAKPAVAKKSAGKPNLAAIFSKPAPKKPAKKK